MKIKSKIKRALFFLLISCCTYSQNGEEILRKVRTQYSSNKSLQFSTTYNLYKRQQDKKVYEFYTGLYFKNADNEVYIKINDTEYLITKRINAQISNEEKAVLITNGTNILSKEYDFGNLFDDFQKPLIKDKKTYWEMEFKAKPITTQPYSKLVLHIGKDYFIQKQIFYYANAMDFSGDYRKQDMEYPRLEIIFGKHSRENVPLALFDTSKYFTVANKKVTLAARYRNYELIDHR
ncbi:hypothetical protein AAEO56_11705 [Flavobacterium sp. DGU11]|uniref:Outer membrane lipoprotein-sorting protein n=1 Tax=Flavobacterium arundinis TaxID=3139143 RepID=A0ABU9HY73_9FLAO